MIYITSKNLLNKLGFLIVLVVVHAVEIFYASLFQDTFPYFAFQAAVLLIIGLAMAFDDKEKVDWKNRTIFFVLPATILMMIRGYIVVIGAMLRSGAAHGAFQDGLPVVFEQIAHLYRFGIFRTLFYSEMLFVVMAVLLGYASATAFSARKRSKKI
ncbi:hypothetical protein J0B03_07670 [Alkalibacter rhizosphaerae]|uniref:Uncharacterized protein n=1 Tax=Alkalibacter rhizosphaerae TaxID=2815577 RepID=A0A974XDA4_9FIRM|nr:hypothetical protein [Alkalibacter rhizosphaerae]QSX07708.1 hypothetical protein J0B03_07670 [Alkalibacter rhizosphaerae]